MAEAAQQNQVATTGKPTGLFRRLAGRYGVESKMLMDTLKSTAFSGEKEVSNDQLTMLCVVADQYGLNPFTRELYAYPDKNKGIVPVVGVDGWLRIINEHAQFDGMSLNYADNIIESAEHARCPEWVEVVINRKDRSNPIVVREYLDECYQEPKGQYKKSGPWQSHTKRMLRHKAIIQAARVAFGFAGIYDPDEAERIIEGGEHVFGSQSDSAPTKSGTTRPEPINAEAEQVEDAQVIEGEPTAEAQAPELISIKDAMGLMTLCQENGVDHNAVCDQFGGAFETLPLDMFAEVAEWIKAQGSKGE